jgi:hypothetical protein
MLFAFADRVNRHLSVRKGSGIPDQKGVLEMIRGLPDDYLFPSNNKVWHGTVALHFCFFLMVRICHPLQIAYNKDYAVIIAKSTGAVQGTGLCPHRHLSRADREQGILSCLHMIFIMRAGIQVPGLR